MKAIDFLNSKDIRELGVLKLSHLNYTKEEKKLAGINDE